MRSASDSVWRVLGSYMVWAAARVAVTVVTARSEAMATDIFSAVWLERAWAIMTGMSCLPGVVWNNVSQGILP